MAAEEKKLFQVTKRLKPISRILSRKIIKHFITHVFFIISPPTLMPFIKQGEGLGEVIDAVYLVARDSKQKVDAFAASMLRVFRSRAN